LGALRGLDSLSAIPEYLDIPEEEAPPADGGDEEAPPADGDDEEVPPADGADGDGGADAAATLASAPEDQTQDSSAGLVGTASPLRPVSQTVTGILPNRATAAAAAEATAAPEAQPVEGDDVTATAGAPGGSGASTQNITRESPRFSPQSRGDSPILFGTGAPGVDNGIRGWGSALKKLGIGGGDAAGGGEANGADGGGAGGGE